VLELFRKGLVEPVFWALVAQVLVTWLVPFTAQWLLLRKMSAERRGRAWNDLTWAAAILFMFLNATTMIPFAWVTRPERGVGKGILALLYGFALAVGVLVLQVALNGLINKYWLGLPFLE
jgi:hypothetical protein